MGIFLSPSSDPLKQGMTRKILPVTTSYEDGDSHGHSVLRATTIAMRTAKKLSMLEFVR